MNPSLFTEITAAEAFRNGDVAGFDWLAGRYLAKASRVANGILRTADAAEDLAREACFRGWDQRHRLIAGREFGPWLVRIVRNFALDLLRHRRCIRLEPFD